MSVTQPTEPGHAEGRWAVKQSVSVLLFWLLSLALWELTVALSAGESLKRLPLMLAFSCVAALVLAPLSALRGLFGKILAPLLLGLTTLFYCVQLVYYHICDSYLSVGLLSVGDEALTNFAPIVWGGILACLPQLILLVIPLVAYFLLRHFALLPRQGLPWRPLVLSPVLAVVLGTGLTLSLPLWGTALDSPVAILHSNSATLERRAEQFGLLTAQVLDLRRFFFSGGVELSGSLDLTDGGSGERNVLPELDFSLLPDPEDEKEAEDLTRLNDYFSGLSGTAKNQYTGYFEGYNLIVICAESFSPYLVDEDLTPTLYRLSQEGFRFENFYGSFSSVTTNGEYSLCLGLMPDPLYSSFTVSMSNYLPFTLAHLFSARGVDALAYHDGLATYYNRSTTHSNMGYDFKAIGSGLDMEMAVPPSDLEMMEKTVDGYIGLSSFHVYYMTHSGHFPYTFEGNAVSEKNRALVEDLDVSEELRAYYACQLELEQAVSYLVERLEEAGKAEETVIVLTGDHLPYGLTDEAYAALAGDAVDEPFWQHKNSFICWNGGMEESVVVEDYCCTQDILPTLLNLFGLPYDSRLLTGRDVLSPCTHLALLEDGSFLTEQLRYDASTGSLTWADGAVPDEAYAQALVQAVNDQLSVSSAILLSDYYGYLFPALGLAEDWSGYDIASIFPDVDGKWYEEEVRILFDAHAVAGSGTGAFDGESPALRCAFSVLLMRLLELPELEDYAAPYTDVRHTIWYAHAVTALWEAGLLPDGELFRPDDPLTTAEAIDILTRTGSYLGLEEPEAWARSAVEETYARQQEAGASTLGEGVLSRGAMAVLGAELLELKDSLPSPS